MKNFSLNNNIQKINTEIKKIQEVSNYLLLAPITAVIIMNFNNSKIDFFNSVFLALSIHYFSQFACLLKIKQLVKKSQQMIENESAEQKFDFLSKSGQEVELSLNSLFKSK